MRITTNINRSATTVLELFKLVTGLALVTAVSVWFGAIGNDNVFLELPVLHQTLVFVAFALLLVRFYHGNSLHILEKYSEGTPASRTRGLDVALPADGFFVMLEGLILLALSFTIRSAQLFLWLLLALLIVDVLWAGTLVRVNEEPDEELEDPADKHLRTWFRLNLVGTFILIVIIVGTLNREAALLSFMGDAALLSYIIFTFILFQTFFDYWLAWRRYFPAPEGHQLMIGAPFTAKIGGGPWTDTELRECIARTYSLCRLNNYNVYSAHWVEEFGEDLREVEEYVPMDMRNAGDAAVYIGITDGTFSNGLAVELGMAAAYNARILLFVRTSATDVSFLEELVRTHNGTVLAYSSADNLVQQLCEELDLKVRKEIAWPP